MVAFSLILRDKLERYDDKYYPEVGEGLVSRFRRRARAVLPQPEYDQLTASLMGKFGSRMPTFWEFTQGVIEHGRQGREGRLGRKDRDLNQKTYLLQRSREERKNTLQM